MSGIAPRCKSARANQMICDHMRTMTRCCVKGWTANKRRAKKKKKMRMKRDDNNV